MLTNVQIYDKTLLLKMYKGDCDYMSFIKIELTTEDLCNYDTLEWYITRSVRPEARYIKAEIISGRYAKKVVFPDAQLRLCTSDGFTLYISGVKCGENSPQSSAIITLLGKAGFSLNDWQKKEIMQHCEVHMIFHK